MDDFINNNSTKHPNNTPDSVAIDIIEILNNFNR